jgi:signal transduction histidine kinase
MVTGNFQKLEQIVINLLQNAAEALTNRDQSIHLSTSWDASTRCVTLVVRDEGCGIQDEHLTQITNPFYTTKRTYGGMGLGLSVALRLAQEHGSEMHFSSNVGKGTTVQVVFPSGADNQ